ncbi:lipocalin-like domain-containing protein [Salinimicrobium sp. CAU 1759]
MKKYLLLLAAFGIFLFVSCSDDDDDNEEMSITGTWELTSTTPPIPGWDLEACPENPTITFTANGTAVWTLYDSENECAESSSEGTWVKNSGNNYTVTVPNWGEVTGTVTFSGANQFDFSTTIQSFPVVLTFQK